MDSTWSIQNQIESKKTNKIELSKEMKKKLNSYNIHLTQLINLLFIHLKK